MEVSKNGRLLGRYKLDTDPSKDLYLSSKEPWFGFIGISNNMAEVYVSHNDNLQLSVTDQSKERTK